jgi:hypothetical protein
MSMLFTSQGKWSGHLNEGNRYSDALSSDVSPWLTRQCWCNASESTRSLNAMGTCPVAYMPRKGSARSAAGFSSTEVDEQRSACRCHIREHCTDALVVTYKHD